MDADLFWCINNRVSFPIRFFSPSERPPRQRTKRGSTDRCGCTGSRQVAITINNLWRRAFTMMNGFRATKTRTFYRLIHARVRRSCIKKSKTLKPSSYFFTPVSPSLRGQAKREPLQHILIWMIPRYAFDHNKRIKTRSASIFTAKVVRATTIRRKTCFALFLSFPMNLTLIKKKKNDDIVFTRTLILRSQWLTMSHINTCD